MVIRLGERFGVRDRIRAQSVSDGTAADSRGWQGQERSGWPCFASLRVCEKRGSPVRVGGSGIPLVRPGHSNWAVSKPLDGAPHRHSRVPGDRAHPQAASIPSRGFHFFPVPPLGERVRDEHPPGAKRETGNRCSCPPSPPPRTAEQFCQRPSVWLKLSM